MTKRVEDISNISNGYLVTPMNKDRLRTLISTGIDDTHDDHEYGWPDHSMWGSDIYPEWINNLADEGIAFIWEFTMTEDFSYFAYNFPTEKVRNNLVAFHTNGKQKKPPYLSKKKREEIETISAVNELLLITLGKQNG